MCGLIGAARMREDRRLGAVVAIDLYVIVSMVAFAFLALLRLL